MEKRKLIGYGLVLLGVFLIINSYAGITGAITGSSLTGSFWGFVSLVLIVGGILIGTTAREIKERTEAKGEEGELEIILADNSNGERVIPDRDYVMIDPEGAFGKPSSFVSLGQLKKELHGLGQQDAAYVDAVRGAYAPKLVEVYKKATEERDERTKGIAREFLGAFGIKINEPSNDETANAVNKTQRMEIRTAFRDWNGYPNSRQREVLREYGLAYDPIHNVGGHPSIYSLSDSSIRIKVSGTPGDENSGGKIGRDIIRILEERERYAKVK